VPRPPTKWSTVVNSPKVSVAQSWLKLADTPGAVSSSSVDDTNQALARGVALVLTPRLADAVLGHRRASVHALVRLGRRDDRFVYAPLLIKNSEVVESSSTRQLLGASLNQLSPTLGTPHPGSPFDQRSH